MQGAAQPRHMAFCPSPRVTLFLGINSLIYYVIIGWLPAILLSHGYSEAQAGSMHRLYSWPRPFRALPYR